MKTNSTLRYRAAWLLGICGLLLGSITVAQATFTVTNLDDSGPGSLRQAIADAAPGDTIDFAVTGTITLTSGGLGITNDLTISGPGPTNLTVSGNNASRVLGITAGIVRICGLTIANGTASSPDPTGGGINNGASLTISNCAVIKNSVSGYLNHPGSGGGVFNWGNLVVQDSQISNNNSSSYGGGIYSDGPLIAINSTISGNHSRYGGAGAFVRTFSMTNVTISGNWTDDGATAGLHCMSGGNISSSSVVSNAVGVGIAGGPLNIQNSIIAGNSGADYSGTLNSLDFNLIGNTNGATITGVTTHNIYGKDPLLGPLADNGGPTPTHALLPGSPAIDHGSSGGLATDQRGLPRPFNFPAYFNADDGSDIGAVEMQERAQTGPVFTVNTTNDVDDGVPGIAHCSLREAVNAANANADTNTINFATAIPGLMSGVTGTITLTNGELLVTNSLSIVGPGPINLVVNGNAASRVFHINAAGSAAISGVTITNGNGGGGSKGGGIFTESSTLTVSNCNISGNYAWMGGGISGAFSTLTVNNCSISGNMGQQDGGGIYNNGFNGGAIHVANSTLSGNSAVAGGGICSVYSGLTVSNCKIRGNSANQGGGIYNDYSELMIRSCTLSGNSAASGGGIFSTWPSAIQIANSTLSSNSADYIGGGIFNNGTAGNSTIQVGNSTLSGNSANQGGGIYNSVGGTIGIGNTILNAGTLGANILNNNGSITSAGYNLSSDDGGGVLTNATDQINTDPLLGPLADLGGPTPTHALRFDSPALDAGHSGGLTTDQRGLPRPIDSPDIANADGGDGSDIGAYEADPNLRLTGIGKAESDIRLNFSTIFGRSYGLEWTDNLPGGWQVLTNGVPGTGGNAQVLDAGTANLPRRFYRGVLLLP